jgi:hypothetical protein
MATVRHKKFFFYFSLGNMRFLTTNLSKKIDGASLACTGSGGVRAEPQPGGQQSDDAAVAARGRGRSRQGGRGSHQEIEVRKLYS